MPGSTLDSYLNGLNLSDDKSVGSDLDPANFVDEDDKDGTDKDADKDTDKDDSQKDKSDTDTDKKDEDKGEDDKKPTLTEREKQLEDENRKLKERLSKGYKNHADLSKKVVTHEDLQDFMKKIDTQRKEEFDLIDKFPESKKQLSDIRTLANEKGLSLEDAFILKNKSKFTDPTRMNAMSSDRYKLVGNYAKKEADDLAEKILSQGPKFMNQSTFSTGK